MVHLPALALKASLIFSLALPLLLLLFVVVPLDGEEHARAEHENLERNEDYRDPVHFLSISGHHVAIFSVRKRCFSCVIAGLGNDWTPFVAAREVDDLSLDFLSVDGLSLQSAVVEDRLVESASGCGHLDSLEKANQCSDDQVHLISQIQDF